MGEEEAATTPCVVAGPAVLAGMVCRVQVEVAEVAVRMVWRVQVEVAEAAVVTRDGVEGEVAAPGSSRSGQAVACPREFIVRVAEQLETFLMDWRAAVLPVRQGFGKFIQSCSRCRLMDRSIKTGSPRTLSYDVVSKGR